MTQWIGAIARGHNGGACLLKDGEVVFNLEEERLSRIKHDGAPLAAITKMKEYTDKLDYFLIAHTSLLNQSKVSPILDYCRDDAYYGLARKLGLLEVPNSSWAEEDYTVFPSGTKWPSNVIDVGNIHHRLHAASAFYNSGFDTACAVIVDGAGSWTSFGIKEEDREDYWEVETLFDCAYPHKFDTKYKHIATKFVSPLFYHGNFNSGFWSGYGELGINWESEENESHELLARHGCGLVKPYEAITDYCGWQGIEAGKTMGLSPYGKEHEAFPPFYKTLGDVCPDLKFASLDIFSPSYPQTALLQLNYEPYVRASDETVPPWHMSNRQDAAWRVQNDSQEQVLALIRKAVRMTGQKNVVLAGGYGLNCVANYYYLNELKDEGINLYVEPMSNDCGTAYGAALLWHHYKNPDSKKRDKITNLYSGIQYNHSQTEIKKMTKKFGGEVLDATDKDVIDLILDRNIVSLFQGRSESGPRALGNRSILYDPTDPNGKDHVNTVKHREPFRPFAGTILQDHVHDWFDLRGMDETPFMMYAVECKPGVEDKIPAILHVDKTCRIQTVTKEQNENYYNLIQEFFERTGCPILFNTSFNLGGEPLVETLEDGIKTLASSDIEYMYLPEYGKMITIKND